MELQTLRDLDLPFDDLTLPDNEPASEPDLAAPALQEADGEPYPEFDGESQGGMDLFGDLGDLLGGGAVDLSVEEVPDGTDLGEGVSSVQEDTDFGNFIDTIPDDFTTEISNEISNGEDGTPPGLLNGFADEIEAERASLGKKGSKNKVPDEDSGMDFSDQDLGDLGISTEDIEGQDTGLPDFDLGSLGPSAEETAAKTDAGTGDDNAELGIQDFPDFDSSESMELFGEEGSVSENDSLGESDFNLNIEPKAEPAEPFDIPDFSSAETEEAPEGFGEAETDLSGFDLGDIPDFDGGESREASVEGEPVSEDAGALDLSGLDFGDISDFGGAESHMSPDMEPSSFDTADTKGDEYGFGLELPDVGAEAILEEVPEDGFDSFSPGAGSLGDGFGIGAGDDFGSLDDFGIPGLDTGFDAKAAEKSKGKKGKAPAGKASEVEEINLTLEELEQFQETLSSYPLNLRMACEELIVEKAVVPEQMSRLIRMLIDGAPAAETAALAGKILDRTIPIPKGYEKRTGEELEAEQSSFAYIFVHNFLPVLRLFMAIALVVLSAGYLSWRYIYTPMRAEKIYKLGMERIEAGEYSRANERFAEAYRINPKKPWFYTYARAFRDSRQYTLAEEKYRELLNFTASKNKRGIPEKAAVLEYADLETNYIGDYQTADNIIRRNILDYYPMDREGLLALGDNSLIWGEYEKERLEDAREAYARLIERYGRTDPLLERMLKYFIRTDNLGQVLALQSHFMSSERRIISSATLAEM
jgi:hypothetical protein